MIPLIMCYVCHGEMVGKNPMQDMHLGIEQ